MDHNSNFSRKIKDSLDFKLATAYVHGGEELFPEPVDVVLQPLTKKPGAIIFPEKTLVTIVRPAPSPSPLPSSSHSLLPSLHGKNGEFRVTKPCSHKKKLSLLRSFIDSMKLFPDHPIIIGGIKEKVHPSYVKLMNSSHHSPQTNAGYLRKDRDGTVYFY